MIEKKLFGCWEDGREVSLFTMRAPGGLTASVCEYGAALVSLRVPDREGRCADVVLGFDSLAEYRAQRDYIGATVGRCANRIRGGTCTLGGQEVFLSRNEGENHLHGGLCGFDRRLWKGGIQAGRVVLSLESPDGEEGYPGQLSVQAVFSLEEDTLNVEYRARTDRDAPVNLTCHSYFQLAGRETPNAAQQRLKIYASFYTPVGRNKIPDGRILPVEGTPMDFRTAAVPAERLDSDFDQLRLMGGYDHNYCLEHGGKGGPGLAAELWDEGSGRHMQLYTDAPGLQFYGGQGLSGRFGPCAGLALEPQHFPNAVNCPAFVSPVLRTGALYKRVIRYRFPRAWGTAPQEDRAFAED